MIALLAVERYKEPISQTGVSMVMHNRRFGSPNRGYSRADSKSATRFVLDEELADSGQPDEPAEIAALLRGRGAAPEPHQRRLPLEELGASEPAATESAIAIERARRSIRSEVREMTREIRPRQRHTEVYSAPARPTLLRRLQALLRRWLS